MGLNLTFRRKIALAIALTAAGTIALCLTALLSLKSVLNSSEHVSELGGAADALMELQIELYALVEQRAELTPDKIEAFQQGQQLILSEFVPALEQATANTDSSIQGYTADIPGLVREHIQTLSEWTRMKTEFGLNAELGLHGELNHLGGQLSGLVSSFSGLSGIMQEVRQYEKDFLIEADPAKSKLALEALNDLITNLTEFGFENYVEVAKQYEAALNEVTARYGEVLTLQQQLTQQVGDIIQRSGDAEHYLEDQVIVAARAESNQTVERAQATMIGVGLLVLILVITLLAWTGIGAIRGLNRTINALNQIAGGNLTVKVDKQADDEFGQLADAVNQMTDDLHGIVSHVTSTSNELSGMSGSLSSAVETIATSNSFTSEQTTSMAAATEQMNATVAEVAQTTVKVNDGAKMAHQAASEGGQIISRALDALSDVAEVVNRNVEQMHELGRRSEKIDVVIEVIKNVAEQTNLLALNAAIEAARAGEAGRGFAVVADEVRTLAEKTVGASNEITEIVHELQAGTRNAIASIETGRENVERGNQYGVEAADAVRAIEGQVETASDQTQQIAVAIEQLASTVKEIAENMEQVSGSLDQSSTESNSIVEASQQVAQRAIELKQMTTRFEVSAA
ncbi:methyl-accepting chemotaxis protein [Motiliproteus coralliicola]|uniref:Methyl-accepting chemotaxis protein n=1 Tax=Motiliproteus coralliicola TaxID=2283196 RepID=A0A369WQY9_9GAMM|nr:methyl-accepting chemotaxis protein [Motiliproteus coralliicola]RDE24112.1 methyl-accepting chemotaxis protein [Motiliproteus coralliicola]